MKYAMEVRRDLAVTQDPEKFLPFLDEMSLLRHHQFIQAAIHGLVPKINRKIIERDLASYVKVCSSL